MLNTPIQQLYTDNSDNTIYVKRDDLIPFSFGGNKVRIAKEFIDDMRDKNCNCMIG